MIRKEYSNSKNVEYIINEDERTITARIKCDAYDVDYMLKSVLRKVCGANNYSGLYYIKGIDQKSQIRPVYTGRAKCHPNDIFNVEFGKKLALLRARDKYMEAINKRLCRILDIVNQFNSAVDVMFSKSFRRELDNSSEIYIIEKEVGLH